MPISVLLVVVGLILLVWSADRFIEGTACVARYAGMSPLLIGMVIVGFGTSAPELTVSALSAWQGNPGLALGNAYGSNITNIALILGVVALIGSIVVHSQVIQKELPILALITVFSLWLIQDGELTRLDAMLLLGVFVGVLGWTIRQGLHNRSDALEKEMEAELESHAMPLNHAMLWLIVGLVLLIVSSRMLVSGAVAIAQSLGISDLVIGLTIVAIGTSLPELASSIAAAKKGEDDIAIGNIIGSNLFNTTAVVGLAGVIQPMPIPADIISRDWPLMALLTASLFAMGYATNGHGRISRLEGAILVAVFAGYTSYLAYSVMAV